MGPERTRVLVRSSCGRRGDPARAPRARPAALRDLLARHDVGWPRGPARQPHAQPGRGAVRRRGIAHPRPAPAGPAPRARRARSCAASAAESRSQARNRELALARLAAKLDAGLRVQPRRTPTRPTKSSQARRVEAKRRRARDEAAAAPWRTTQRWTRARLPHSPGQPAPRRGARSAGEAEAARAGPGRRRAGPAARGRPRPAVRAAR